MTFLLNITLRLYCSVISFRIEYDKVWCKSNKKKNNCKTFSQLFSIFLFGSTIELVMSSAT